jgi:hypothetical protein
MVKHVFPCACCRTCYSFSLPPWFQLIWTGLVLPKWAAFSIEWFPCPFFKITREILCFSADQKGNISLAAKRHSQLVLLVFFATDCRNMSKSENCCHFRWNVELYYVVFSSFSLPLSLLFPWRFFCSFSMCAPFRSLPFLQFHLLISFLFSCSLPFIPYGILCCMVSMPLCENATGKNTLFHKPKGHRKLSLEKTFSASLKDERLFHFT